jgi:hypothetical protein
MKYDYGVAFEHTARQYYIRCAERSIKLAPLAEFKNAMDWLKQYDHAPTPANRKSLERAYLCLVRVPDVFGYSAVGEVYHGLRRVLYETLHNRDGWASWSCQHFAEAKYCAAAVAFSNNLKHAPDDALSAERDVQEKIYLELFDKLQLLEKDQERELPRV